MGGTEGCIWFCMAFCGCMVRRPREPIRSISPLALALTSRSHTHTHATLLVHTFLHSSTPLPPSPSAGPAAAPRVPGKPEGRLRRLLRWPAAPPLPQGQPTASPTGIICCCWCCWHQPGACCRPASTSAGRPAAGPGGRRAGTAGAAAGRPAGTAAAAAGALPRPRLPVCLHAAVAPRRVLWVHVCGMPCLLHELGGCLYPPREWQAALQASCRSASCWCALPCLPTLPSPPPSSSPSPGCRGRV